MITVTFLNGCILATAEQSLWQYSYNQQLQINGLELPGVFTVDFCNEGDTTTVAMIGSSGVVDIPNELLTSGRDIVAYVFQKSTLTGGITRCEIRIDVLTRPERDDETPTPEQEAVIDQYIAELNEGVEKANESAEDAEAWAVGERDGEPVSESDPTYENNAKYWAENISGQLEDYRTAADQDAIDSAQDGEINALTNLLNKKQSKITANGILKGDGNGGISAAVPGMDYLPTSALYAYRSAIKQDEIDNAQNANIAKNADDIADVKTTADTALQPAALAPYRTAADQDTIDNAQTADIAAINDKIPSTASKNNKLVAWSTFNGQLGTKQAKITANGILKGDGAGGVSAAVAGTDYLAPSALDAYRTAAAQDEIDAAQDEDIADVEAAVDQKAPIIINSASGDIAHFEDGADNMPVKQLSVNVSPIQDLHGYDSPWPDGGGVNKLDPTGVTVYTSSTYGFSLTWNANEGSYNLNGTYTGTNGSASFRALNAPSSVSELNVKGFSSSPNFSQLRWQAGTNQIVVELKNMVQGTSYNITIYPLVYEGSTAPTAWSPYSNICPISGRTSATVTRCGKNLVKTIGADRTNAQVAYTLNSDGTIKAVGTASETSWWRAASSDLSLYWPIKAGTYKLTGGKSNNRMLYLIGYLADGTVISNTSIGNVYDKGTGITFTLPQDGYINYQIQIASGEVCDDVFYPMIRFASDTDDTYEPYAGNTYTIQLGETVYGGTLDVTNGTLTVDRAVVDLGTLAWGYESGTAQFYSNGILSTSINWHTWSAVPPLLCSQYKPISNAQLASSDFCVGYAYNSKQLRVKDSTYTDAATFKTAMSGVQLVYELATPLEITLTPTQIDTLLGTNNIWSDAGPVDVDYRADTKLYIDNIHKPTENDMTADAQIASGKYFLIGGNLYKSTTVIPAGDTIIPGTNCIKTNLAEALNALNA